MCQNSLLENEQIEKCIENGMPARLVKTLQSTLRKRSAKENVNKTTQQNIGNENSLSNNDVNPPAPQLYVSKCPFGHGKFTTPATAAQLFLTSPLLPQPSATTTTAATALINNIIDDSNNNSNDGLLYERLTQISKLSTTLEKTEIIATAADKNCNAVTNSTGHFDGGNKKLLPATNKNVVYNGDILAKSIQITREFAYKMQQAIRRLQQSNKIYTLLTKTTQPAHIIAVAIVTFVLLAIWPELIDNSSSSQQSATVPIQDVPARRNVMFALITYLGTFSIHFGTQIWMTFVSGLSLYFSLPRHVFGECQQVLFPKYFAMNAALSITMLVIYAKFFINTWTLAKCVQFGSLALTGSIELLVRLYLAPPMLRLMHEKYKIEGSIGSGNEIGSLVQGDLINCPHYQRIHKTFRRLHMTVAFGNIIAMACSCLQLYNIAGQLQVSIAY